MIRGPNWSGKRQSEGTTKAPRTRREIEQEVTEGTERRKSLVRHCSRLMRVVVVAIALAVCAEVCADLAPPIKRLPDPARAKVLAALAGLIILGFGMVLLTWLGARVTQRYRKGAAYFRPTPRPGEHDWAKKPLAGDEPSGREGR